MMLVQGGGGVPEILGGPDASSHSVQQARGRCPPRHPLWCEPISALTGNLPAQLAFMHVLPAAIVSSSRLNPARWKRGRENMQLQ